MQCASEIDFDHSYPQKVNQYEKRLRKIWILGTSIFGKEGKVGNVVFSFFFFHQNTDRKFLLSNYDIL